MALIIDVNSRGRGLTICIFYLVALHHKPHDIPNILSFQIRGMTFTYEHPVSNGSSCSRYQCNYAELNLYCGLHQSNAKIEVPDDTIHSLSVLLSVE